jgi:hypothetical protein
MNLYNSKGLFQMPSEAELAELPADVREKFDTVRIANDGLVTATSNKQAAEKAVTDAIEIRDAARKALPKWTPTDNAKAFIASERATR